jgi:hypothetical protein
MSNEPISLDPLWDVCYVANNDEEAQAQAWRQYDAYDGKVVLVHGLIAWNDDGNVEPSFNPPIPVRVIGAFTDSWSWDGEEMIPEWEVAPIDPDQVATDTRGRTWRLSDLRDLTYFAPAVGTEAGFAGTRERPMIYPEVPT